MKYYYELDENDIYEIIAKFLGVAPGDVRLTIKKQSRGHGPTEHDENVVTCTVVKPSAVIPPKAEPQNRECFACAHYSTDGEWAECCNKCVRPLGSNTPTHWEAITRPED